jgi:MFS family permease
MSSTIYIGAAIGGIVSAFLSEWTGRRKVPIVLGALGTSICFLFLIFYPPQSTVWATALLFTIGLFCSFHYMGFASTCELTEKSMNATAVYFGGLSMGYYRYSSCINYRISFCLLYKRNRSLQK